MKIGGNRRSSNVDDRRGQSGGRGGMRLGRGRGGNSAMIGIVMRLLFSRTGRKFILPIGAIAVLGFVLFPNQMKGLVSSLMGGGAPVSRSAPAATSAASDELAKFSSAVLDTTEDVWNKIFTDGGSRYPEPGMVLYSGGTASACGSASAAMGPFYCPPDQKIYLDVSFFREMETRMNAGGDFARAYVIAHEVGHHVQNVLGVLDKSQRQKKMLSKIGANAVQVKVELQADCFAGIWAKHAQGLSDVALEAGDFEEAIGAARAVGDDTIQKKSQGYIVPENFTHGTAAERINWFKSGYKAGTVNACNTGL
ncbi:YpfJ protein, zinc metalloprotease superfamily [hydrothermal vent metagenome]|uniref:YpfJ protein, zinc metalloprotease superfamily n=1 Tax=hydrothermal vent metagenome TaxID=652676 RepID=A0A3B0RLF8_9ZZZZ